jgi:hypothetical protein
MTESSVPAVVYPKAWTDHRQGGEHDRVVDR